MKCPKCGYDNKEDTLACGLCGEILISKPASAAAPAGTVSQGTGGKSCPNHPGRKVDWFCSSCKKDFCSECLTEIKGQRLCPACKGKGLLTESRYFRQESFDMLKNWWVVIGILLVINYFIPLMSFMGQTAMFWDAFKGGFLQGFVFLLPTLCGALLIVMAVASSSGVARGLIISLAGLGAFMFYYFGQLSGSTEVSILLILEILSFILVLVTAHLRTNYEQSATARLMGGIVGSIFLLSTIILIIMTLSTPGADVPLTMSVPTSGFGVLITFNWIISIICLLGAIAAGILSVVNFARLPSSETVARYSFRIGLIALIILAGWQLLSSTIIILGVTANAGST